MNEGIKLLAFDVDWTLGDMEPAMRDATLDTLRQLGASQVDEAFHARYFSGKSASEGLAAISDIFGVSICEAAFTSLYVEMAVSRILTDQPNVVPGVNQALSALSDQGKILVTWSNGRAKLTRAFLERTNLLRYFDDCLFNADVSGFPKHKSANMLLQISQRFNVAPEHMAIVGDGFFDMMNAAQFGVPVRIGTTYYPALNGLDAETYEARLGLVGATRVIHGDFSELLDALEGPIRPSLRGSTLKEAKIPASVTNILTHHRSHHVFPNVFDPRTFNEKVLHRILFNRDPLLTKIADKFAVRGIVERILGSSDILTQLYHVTDNPEDIPFDDLPQKFVIKPTHGSGWVRVVRDKSEFDMSSTEGQAARQSLIEQCNEWLKQNFYFYMQCHEWQYKNIPPKIVVEEFIDDGSSIAPVDYKLWVFGGKVHLIETNVEMDDGEAFTYYDRDWNKLDVKSTFEGKCKPTTDIPKPARLDDMIKAAEALAQGTGLTGFVRADFYATADRIYFGELTLTPSNGRASFDPPEFDRALGALWPVDVNVKIPCDLLASNSSNDEAFAYG